MLAEVRVRGYWWTKETSCVPREVLALGGGVLDDDVLNNVALNNVVPGGIVLGNNHSWVGSNRNYL